MKALRIFLLLVAMFALPGARLPGLPSPEFPDGKLITYQFASTTTAGIYSIGYAWPVGTLDFRLAASSSFDATLYECEVPSPDSDNDGDLSDEVDCSRLTRLNATTSVYPLQTEKAWYVLDIDTAEDQTAGSMLTLKGTFDQVTMAPGRLDIDGDGLLEYIRFPQDLDGDGTAWEECDCGGTPNMTPAYSTAYLCGTFRTSDTDETPFDWSAGDDTANNPDGCTFHGERKWPDASDDASAGHTITGVGTLWDFEKGNLQLKGRGVPTSDDTWPGSTRTLCWDSATDSYSQTCQTYEDSGTSIGQFALFAHSSMLLQGAGADPNGDRDLKWEGTYWSSNNGPRQWWDDTTVGNAYLLIGREDIMEAGSADILVDLPYTDNRDPGTICVQNSGSWVTTNAAVGRKYAITMNHDGGALKRVIAYIGEVTATACGSTGLEVKISGATGPAEHMADNTDYQGFLGMNLDDDEAEPYITGPIDEAKMAHGIVVKDMAFTHQDYVGKGGCPFSDTEDGDCDNGALIRMGPGYNHRLDGISIVQTHGALGSGQVIDSGVWSMGWKVENSTFRFNQGGLIDIPAWSDFANNVVSDNALMNNQTSAGGTSRYTQLVRAQADGWTISNNVFLRNSGPSMDDGTESCPTCTLTGQLTSLENAIVEVHGHQGRAHGNRFEMNQNTCILVAEAARHNTIDHNDLTCGSAQRSVTPTEPTAFRSSNVDRGFALAIISDDADPTGHLTVEANRFHGQGARFNSHNNESQAAPHAAAHVVITGVNLNVSDGASGGLSGPIKFLDNEVRATDSQESVFVVMRRQTDPATNGDPDAEQLFFDGNDIEDGNLFAMYTTTSSYPTFGGIETLTDTQPDVSGNGTGLAQCGRNLINGSWETNFAGTYGWATGDPTVKQCAAVEGNAWTYADPCADKQEGYQFYNDTSDYMCMCNGSGDDVQVHSPATACF